MVRVDWAAPAATDLREVLEFIARDSPRYAQLTVESIGDVVVLLWREGQPGAPPWPFV